MTVLLEEMQILVTDILKVTITVNVIFGCGLELFPLKSRNCMKYFTAFYENRTRWGNAVVVVVEVVEREKYRIVQPLDEVLLCCSCSCHHFRWGSSQWKGLL